MNNIQGFQLKSIERSRNGLVGRYFYRVFFEFSEHYTYSEHYTVLQEHARDCS